MTFRDKEGLTDRGLRAASEAVGQMPRRVFEAVVVLVAAVVIVYLFVWKSPYYAVGAVFVLITVIFLMRKPVMLTYALLLFLPINWLNLLGRSLRITTVLTLIGTAYYLSQAILDRARPRFNRVYLAYGLYILSCLLSLYNSQNPFISYLALKHFTISLLILYILTASITDMSRLRTAMWIILGWGLAQSALGMLQTFVSVKFFPAYYLHTFGLPIIDAYSVGGVRRASGTFQIGPRYVMFLMLPLAIVVAGFFSKRVFSRRTWLLMMAPFVVGVFVSLTRIALALSLMYVAFYNFFERRRQAMVASIGGLLVIGVLVTSIYLFIIPTDAKYALKKRFADNDEDVYMDRLYFLWNALGAFSEHPLLGIGLSTYEGRSWEYMQKYPVPWRQYRWDVARQRNMPESVPVHNEYGRMLAEQGIFSIPIFIFLLLSALHNLRFAYDRTKSDLIKTMAIGSAIYLAAMSIYWFFHEYFMEEPYISMLPFALSIIMYNIVERENEGRADDAPS